MGDENMTSIRNESSMAAANQGDTMDIWKLPTFASASGPYQTNWASVTKYRTPHWYRDVKFGYWAHWDPQTVPEGGDWFAMHTIRPNTWRVSDRTRTNYTMIERE